MTDPFSNPPLGEYPSAIQTCQSQHQTWATALVRNEQEIDQLLTLLADLPNDTCRGLHHHTVDYAQGLDQLKTRIHRLRGDVVCTGAGCPLLTPPASCPDSRFVPPGTDNLLISNVSADYSLVKDRCQSFFGELMQLNLI